MKTIKAYITSALAAHRRKQAFYAIRSNPRVGNRVEVVRGDQRIPCTVLNIKYFKHGETEVYVQAHDTTFATWVGISMIYPA